MRMVPTETRPRACSEGQPRQCLRVERPVSPQPALRVELVHVRLPECAVRRICPAGNTPHGVRNGEGLVCDVGAAHKCGALGDAVAQEFRVAGGLPDDLWDHVALAQQLLDGGVEVGDVGGEDRLDGRGLRRGREVRPQRVAQPCLLDWGVGEQLRCPRQEGCGCLVTLLGTGQLCIIG